jgi:membrane protease YdiL (CAAX protease family)
MQCLIIAIDNFQFCAYFNGKMQLVYDKPTDIMLFGLYCLSVGLFEECLFRGLVFGILADVFPQNKKGFLLTYFVSSLLFGAMHIFNGISGATIMQVGYSVLTGGLFAFCLAPKERRDLLLCRRAAKININKK